MIFFSFSSPFVFPCGLLQLRIYFYIVCVSSFIYLLYHLIIIYNLAGYINMPIFLAQPHPCPAIMVIADMLVYIRRGYLAGYINMPIFLAQPHPGPAIMVIADIIVSIFPVFHFYLLFPAFLPVMSYGLYISAVLF